MADWFLLLTLLFPRLTLLLAWLTGGIPQNSTPFFADVIGTWMVPNFLIAYWIWETPGVHPVWMVMHLAVGLWRLVKEREKVYQVKDNRQKTDKN